jgi:ankyrin repeat protein
MKISKIYFLLFFIGLSASVRAQQMPAEITSALQVDDTVKLSIVLTKDNINACYGNYSVLSDAIRNNAANCFNWLIKNGADVNKSCSGYVPPLMHAAKYGRFEMVKILVAKGANINYKYEGSFEPANGQTPITYAEKYQHQDIADYLKSIKQN